MPELKTVAEFQKEALIKLSYTKQPSGVACPNCEAELLVRARFPNSDPPIMLVDCPGCEFSTSLLDS